MAKFTVDTKLFRELGELLVGRESTALVELIKNSYDADARQVTVFGEDLRHPDTGILMVVDDGVGMTLPMFESGFLTIAGRTKTDGEVRSKLFDRRFTGEKGVGRLAAHKLAAVLSVASRRWDGSEWQAGEPLRSLEGVDARIDWEAIEEFQDLAEVEHSSAVTAVPTTGEAEAGTRLTLTKLRRTWTARDFDNFFADVATLVPADPLVAALAPRFAQGEPLFEVPRVRDASGRDPGFTITYGGDLRAATEDVPALAEAAYWIIEISCDAPSRLLQVSVRPTRTALRDPKFTLAEPWLGTYPLPQDVEPISFTARIFEKEGEAWSRAFRSVRVYLEGFRVPPYGDAVDDWLGLDADYRARGRGEQTRLKRFAHWEVPEGDEEEGLVVKANAHYFGAVFLTREGASTLRMLVNREGFLPSPAWDFLRDAVRWAIGIQVRQRRLASRDVVAHRKVDARRRRESASRADEGSPPSAFQARALHQEAVAIVREMRSLTAAGDIRTAGERLDRLEAVVSEANELSAEGASEAVMFRVLASIGLEQAAFVHEILGLGVTAETVADGLERLSRDVAERAHAVRLRSLAVEARELRDRLRRNGIYLADMTGVDARRRRSRLKLRERLDSVISFHRAAADRRAVSIENDIPADLLSPPIFPAEASALFSNLLSNAVKFAGSPGRVLATGSMSDEEVVIRVENTGTRVDLKGAERWFEPFRSTTAEVDATLGQGMGLGLTVSRSLMDEYGGVIEFVTPSSGYETALELRWPRR